MVQTFIHSFVTLFATANPLSFLPLYLVLVSNLSAPQQRQVAFLSVLIAGPLLIAFALVGNAVLSFLGITIGAFQVAGGLLLFVIAFRMVFGETEQTHTVNTETDNVAQIAAFPLAIPMIAGPGAISATIIIATQNTSILHFVSLIAAIIVLMIVTVGVLLASERLDSLIGKIGRIVMGRLFGTILAALSAQFVANGVIKLIEFGTKQLAAG